MNDFNETFNTFIKGQPIVSQIDVRPGKHYTNGSGIECENGYKYISQGRNCSGEDCNTTWILDEKNNIIATKEW